MNQAAETIKPLAVSIASSTAPCWYAIQTFFSKELKLAQLLEEKGLTCFVPMQMSAQPTDPSLPPKLVPVVHNLLFLEKTDSETVILELLKDVSIPFRLMRNRETRKIYEIPNRQMVELRAACDPSYSGNLYMEADQAEARPGHPVRVIRGPFKGMEGKLTQYKKKYYVVVTIASLGVLLHIPRWYCEKIG